MPAQSPSVPTALRALVGVKGDEVKVQVRARTDAAGQQMAVGGIGQAERDIAESCQALRRALRLAGCIPIGADGESEKHSGDISREL